MDVLIAGGHGKIALRLERLLASAGHTSRALIRNPDHTADVEAAGATAVVFDLEHDEGLDRELSGTDAVVFAAGAGPGSGAERKLSVDLGGATKLIDACRAAGVRRYVIVSAMNTERPDRWSEAMTPYYEAKRKADAAVRESGLEYTVVRPGLLTDDAGTGLVELGTPLDRGGSVTRDDVAAVLAAVLETPATIGVSFDVLGGETPVADAVASLPRS
jgi:uncharacterized protein YbjT (DUF2867 family)